MTTTQEWQKWADIVADFRKHKIRAFLPGERDFELSVATGNLVFRFTQPDCVVQPENAHEVSYVIKRANKFKDKLDVTIKCGGHSYTGYWTTSRGILMDLRYMNDVRLDREEGSQYPKQAVVAAGARWGDVYRKLMQIDYRGCIVNGGRCPSVGVSGFLLGGGLGPFTRKVGMGCDTVLAMKMVNYKGKEVEVSKDNNPDLFWALRGGGCANFGVVTEFTLAVKRLRGDNVTAARWSWMPLAVKDKTPEEAKADMEKTMTAFYSTDWPVEMTIDTNWMMDVKGGKGDLSIRFNTYFDGNTEQFDKVIKDHFVATDAENTDGKKIVNEGLMKLMLRRRMDEPSTRFLYETLVQMWEEEARDAIPTPEKNSYQKYASFCLELSPDIATKAVKIVQEEQKGFATKFSSDSASLWVTFIHSGGNVAKIAKPKDTAYPWRDCTFQTYVTVKWTDKWLEAEATAALWSIKEKLKTLSMTFTGGAPASFINFSDVTLDKTKQHEMAYYGENHKKLQDIKKVYDPDNFFKNPWDRQINKPRVKEATDSVDSMLSMIEKTADEISEMIDKEEDTDTLVDYLDQLELLEDMAKDLVDLNARQDWDTYKLPPDDLLEDIYGRKYIDLF